ncbi:MAG: hypothetical protein U0527_15230 [Candidatus Eisenbacteria bacterium]
MTREAFEGVVAEAIENLPEDCAVTSSPRCRSWSSRCRRARPRSGVERGGGDLPGVLGLRRPESQAAEQPDPYHLPPTIFIYQRNLRFA